MCCGVRLFLEADWHTGKWQATVPSANPRWATLREYRWFPRGTFVRGCFCHRLEPTIPYPYGKAFRVRNFTPACRTRALWASIAPLPGSKREWNIDASHW